LTEQELLQILTELRALPSETEWVEFKAAQSSFSFKELGEYFSALSNEANLHNKASAWLAFGVEDKTHDIIGSHYRPDRPALDSLKHEIAQKTTSSLTFTEIHELFVQGKRIVLFQIPPAPRGIPIAWEGHYYGRNGESLGALNLHKIEVIRRQVIHEDWSAQVCETATLADLDPAAITKARNEFVIKNPSQANDVASWDDSTFLNKAKILRQDRITNAAIILLGRPESASLITPSVAQISWFLKDQLGNDLDYAHFGPPFLLNVDAVFAKIRNLTIRHLPAGTLFPLETTQYDPWVVREALHNCIAHQDYSLQGRITLVESPSRLLMTNLGNFLPGSVEAVIQQDSPPEKYGNRFLADAMVSLKMIDTQGGGIKKMFLTQARRFFPLPDYDLTKQEKVVVSLRGEIIDERYSQLLMKRTDLDLWTIILLDKVQKKIRIERAQYRMLRSQETVEGRYPNIFVSAVIARATGEKAQHILNKGMDKKYYLDLILELIAEHGPVSRDDIDRLLYKKLPEVLSPTQKKNRIHNYLRELVRESRIINQKGTRGQGAQWIVTQS
jgi:ATP-dependent DNA helicase RecG